MRIDLQVWRGVQFVRPISASAMNSGRRRMPIGGALCSVLGPTPRQTDRPSWKERLANRQNPPQFRVYIRYFKHLGGGWLTKD